MERGQIVPSVPNKVKSKYRIDLSRLARFFILFSFKNLQTGEDHGKLAFNLKKVVSCFITLMVPSELKAKSNRWFTRTVANVLIICFLSLQILPPGWADVISLEDQVQKQIPQKAPSEAVHSAPRAEASKTSIDFLQAGSPLSSAEILTPAPVPPGLKRLPESDLIKPFSRPLQGEPVNHEPILPSPLESPPSLSTGEIIPVDLVDPFKDFTPVGEPLREADEKNFSGNTGASLTLEETKEKKDEKSQRQEERTDLAYDYERYEFEDALDLLRPEYASAVIVKSLTKENLESLLKLGFEVGVIVHSDEIVLFTTGNKEEIGVTSAAQNLLKQASFISHTHVTESAQKSPSSFDFEAAVESPLNEYVLTQEGVYAYNQSGLLNGGNPFTLDEYLSFLEEAQRLSNEDDFVKTRGVLNDFIHQMDLYNQALGSERNLFRQSSPETILYQDDFNRTSVGTDWLAVDGNWKIDSDPLKGMRLFYEGIYSGCAPAPPGILTLKTPLTSADYEVSALFEFVSGWEGRQRGLLLRYQDKNNYYFGQVLAGGQKMRIIKVAGGMWTTLAEASIPAIAAGSDHTIGFSAEGSTLKLYWDGALKVEAQDSTFKNGTAAIYTYAERNHIDDFKITSLKPETPTVNPPTINSVPTYTNNTAFTLTGTKAANTSIWINGIERVPINVSTSWSYSLSLSEGNNAFAVAAKDSQGTLSTAVNASITLDTKPPEIVFTSPQLINKTFYLLTYTVDGVVVQEVKDLVEGPNVFSVTKTDVVGNSATKSFTVTLDSIPPEIIFTSAALTNKANYILTYTVDGVASQENKVLTEGNNTLSVTKNDLAGNSTAKSLTVTLDSIPPDIIFTSSQITNKVDYVLTYTVDGVVTEENKVLVEGENTLSVTKTDEAGNKTIKSLTVRLDTIAPNIVMTSPQLTNAANYTLAYTVDGVAAQENRTLLEGQNTISVTKKDQAGNEATRTYIVTLDTQAPEIIISSSVTTNSSAYTLIYTVDGTQKQRQEILNPGSNTLTITETDLAQNTSTITHIVTYTLPVITVNPPTVAPLPEYTNSSTLILNGTKPANTSIWVNGSEQIPSNASTTWSYSATLSEGANPFAVTAKDPQGTLSTAVNALVILDTKPPEIVFTSPQLMNQTSYTLTYTVDGVTVEENKELAEGENSFPITKTDLAGNSTTKSFVVMLDTIAPQVVLNSAPLTNNSTYALSYTVDGVQKNESLALQEGQNAIARSFQDPAGNQTQVNWTVTLDTVPPNIAFTSSQLTNETNYTLAYTVDGIAAQENKTLTEGENSFVVTKTDPAGNSTTKSLSVTLDSIPPEIVFTSSEITNKADYVLTYTVDGVAAQENKVLAEGNNPFSVTKTDLAGNTITKSYSVTLDTIPPSIIFTSGPLTNNPTYTLTYTVDGTAMQESKTLVEGQNTILVTKTDLAGNATTKTYSITLDTIPPQIAFTSAQLTNKANYILTYTVDGVTVEENKGLVEGPNAFSVTETDVAGNSTIKSLTVTLDSIPPDIIFTSSQITNKADYILTYTVDGTKKEKAVSLTEGENTLTIEEEDQAGNKTTLTYVITYTPPVIPVDPPTITLLPQYTNQSTITLSGTKPANTSVWVNGTERVSSNASTTWSYAASLTEGPNSFSIITKNNQGTQSTVVNASITHDTIVPTGSMNINSGATYANSTSVTLNLSATDTSSGLDRMSFSNDNVTYTTTEVYATTKTFVLPTDDGTKTIYVKYYDKAGNVSTVYSKQITLDTKAPTAEVIVNGGAAYTNSRTVTLSITATDGTSGVFEMSYSPDGVSWEPWEPFQPTKAVSLPEGHGSKLPHVRIRDRAGNITYRSDTIVLDTTAPTGSVAVGDGINYADGATYTGSPEVTLKVTVSDAGSGAEAMRFSTDGGNTWTEWEAFSQQKPFVLPEGEGPKLLHVQFRDKVDNVSDPITSFPIVLDPNALQVVMTSSPFTNQAPYTLAYIVDGAPKEKIFSLDSGENVITITGTDRAGKTFTKDFMVTYFPDYVRGEKVYTLADKVLKIVMNPFPVEENYDAKAAKWDQTEIDLLGSLLDQILPAIQSVYGNPFQSLAVALVPMRDQDKGGVYSRRREGGRTVWRQVKVGMLSGILGAAHTLIHEFAHAFMDDAIIQVPNPNLLFKEGMTEAVADLALRYTGLSGHDPNAFQSGIDDIHYEALVGESYLGGLGYSGGGHYPYDLGSYFWSKLYLEDPTFFSRFSESYYGLFRIDPTIRTDQTRLLDLVASLKPTVEGRLFYDWLASQNMHLPSPDLLETRLGEGLYIRSPYSNLPSIYAYEITGTTIPQGSESLPEVDHAIDPSIPGTDLLRRPLTGREVKLLVYDANGNLVDNDSKTTPTTSAGIAFGHPVLPKDYTGRLEFVAQLIAADGSVNAEDRAFYTSIRGLSAYAANGYSTKPDKGGGAVFGVLTTVNHGEVTLKKVATEGPVYTAQVINGAFNFPDLPRESGTFEIRYRNPYTGQEITRLFTKDKSQYYVEFDTHGINTDKDPPQIVSISANPLVRTRNVDVTFTATKPLSKAILYYRKAGEVASALITRDNVQGSALTFNLVNLEETTSYEYWVEAHDLNGFWVKSEIETFSTGDATPPETSPIVSSVPTITKETVATFTLGASEAASFSYRMKKANDPYSAWQPVSGTSLTLAFQGGARDDGTYTIEVQAEDATGNADPTPSSFIWTLDTKVPTGSATINDGAVYTTSPTVLLNLTAMDETSGVDAIRFSTDGETTWTSWEAFAASKSFTLSSEDGSKTIKVELKDKAGNVAIVTDTIMLDTTPPVISAVTSSNISSTGATINWTTNEVSDSQIEYRLQGSVTWVTGTLNSSLVTSHSMDLTGLTANMTYEYRVKSKDQANNLATQSTISTFKTLTPPDTTAPVVVAITTPGTTDLDPLRPGLQVNLGSAVTYHASATDASAFTWQWIYTSSGGPETVSSSGSGPTIIDKVFTYGNSPINYTWIIRVTDASNQISQQTLNVEVADYTAPVISAVTSTGLTSSVATINWTTNETSDSQVEYRVQSATTWLTNTINPSLVTNHSMNLTGLNASATYEYRVKSKDTAGNLQTSTDFVFTTQTLLPPVVGVNPPVNVTVLSKGYDDGNISEIYVNGNSVLNAVRRGFTVAVIDEVSGALLELRSYDTYASSAASESMATFIQSIPQGRYVAVTVADEGSANLTVNAKNALYTIGIATTFYLGYRDSYAAVGRKGLNPGEAIEKYVRRYSGQAMVQAGPPQTEPNLTGYWSFDNISNNTISDLSGNSNTGTLMNGVSPSLDHPNNSASNTGSLSFDGVDDSVSLLKAPAIGSQSGFTYAIWVKVNVIGGGSIYLGDGDYIIDRTTGTTALVDLKEIGSGQFGFQVRYDDDTGLGGPIGGTITPGTWQHVAMVREYGVAFRLYVDGVLVASTADNGKSLTVPIPKIGMHAKNINNGLNGNADDFRIYDRSLSQVEIQNLAVVTDTTAPVIGDVKTSNVTSTSVTIAWTTNETSNSQIEYRVKGSAAWIADIINSSLVTSHSVNLTGLTADITYEYRVKSKDQAGNLQISSPYTFSTNPLTSETGLISHYEFNGTAQNNSAANLNGTLSGNPTFVPGPIGNALQFDGVDDYVNVPNSSFPLVTNNFTMALWVNPTATHQIDGESTYGYAGTSGQRYAIYPSHGTIQYGAGHAGAGISVGTNGISVYEHADAYMPPTLVYSAPLSGWNYVVVVYENKQPKLYLNGVLVKSGLTSSRTVHPGQDIGEDGTGYGYYAGGLDDVRIYNRKLSAQEISALANNELSDPTAPVISAVTSGSITSTGVTITWTTDENSDSQIEYRVQGSATWTANTINSSFVTSHSMNLAGLTANTTYEYRVRSKDQANNLAIQSTISTFKTLTPPATEPGLTGYWNFDTVTANTVSDLSGNSNMGTLMNGTSLSTDHPDNSTSNKGSLSFDGVNDYVEVPGNNLLNLTGEVTVAGWIKITGTGKDQKIMGYQNGSSGGYKLGLTPDNKIEFEIRDAANNYYLNRWVAGGTMLQAGVWYQVVGVYSDAGNYIRTYVNGVLDRELITSGVLAPTTGSLKIGREPSINDYFFNGLIDDLRIYNRTLSQTEIQNLAGNTQDTTPPMISVVTSSDLTSTSATITWTTNEASNAQIEYGLTTSYGSSTTLNSSLVTTHSQALSSLAASTLYHYRVKSKDQAGNLQTSADFTFTTSNPPDTTAPMISAVTSNNLTSTGVTIDWATDEASDSQVEYGTTTAYGLATPLKSPLVTNHSQTLTDLQANTTYYYRVKSKDQAGNVRISDQLTFKTLTPQNQTTFTDNFNRTSIGSDWTVVKGWWVMNNNKLFQRSTTVPTGLLTLNVPLGSADVDAQASFEFTDLVGGNDRGIVVRYQDANNFYYGQLSREGGKARIIKVQNGVWTTLVEAFAPGIPNYTYHMIRLSAQGSNLKLYINGALQVEANDSIFSTGKVGFYTNRYYAHVDDFSVTTSGSPVIPVSSPTVVLLPQYTNQSQITLSGTKSANTSVWINGVERMPPNSSTTWSYVANLAEGANSFAIAAKDLQGTLSSVVTASSTFDPTIPTGTININSSAQYTNSTSVTLNLSATDALSGIHQMSFSTDNLNWSSPEAYATTKTFVLPTGDGNKTVYVKYYDKAGNVSTIFSKSVTLDATPPNVVFTSPVEANNLVYHLTYTVDGTPVEETRILEKEGENILTVTKTDQAGNVTPKSLTVILNAPPEGPTETTFTLTTQNGELLKYVNDKLNEVKLADGSTSSNLLLDSANNPISDDLKLSDGSIQILEDGKVLGYRKPDGTQFFFTNGEIQREISKDGITTLYSYLKDASRNVTQTTLENDNFKSIYDAAKKLKETFNKQTRVTTKFVNGLISEIIHPDSSRVLYAQTMEAGDLVLRPSTFVDSLGQLSPFTGTPAQLAYLDYLLLKYDPVTLNLKEAQNKQGKILIFENGLLKSTTDDQGNPVTFTFNESVYSNIVNAQIAQNGIIATYDSSRRLSTVKINDFTIHYKAGSSEIDFIEKADGTELYDLIFNQDGFPTGAKIIDPEGNTRIYVNGELIQTIHFDQTEIFFDHDRIATMILPDRLKYHFNYTPEKIVASLDSSIIPSPSAVVRIEYAQDLSLKAMIKQNNEIIRFLDNQPFQIESPNEQLKVYSYERDAAGKVISSKMTQGNLETYLDANDQPIRSVIHPSADNPHTLEVRYKYGKIREVYKDSVLTFKYSYTFDNQGNENTVIEDLEEHITKIYRDELLTTSLHQETSVLSSYSYADDKVSEVKVSRLGRTLHTYHYTYQGTNTIVTDEEAVIRTYDPKQKLIFLEKDNQKFSYEYFLNDEAKEIIEEKLIEKKLSDGSVVYYEKGDVSFIDIGNGNKITDITLDENHKAAKTTVTLSSGIKQIFTKDELLEEILLDGTHLYFTNNQLSKIKDVTGTDYLIHAADRDALGNFQSIWINQNGVTEKYSIDGNLEGLNIKGTMMDSSFYSFTKTLDSSNQFIGFSLIGPSGSYSFSHTGEALVKLTSIAQRKGTQDIVTFISKAQPQADINFYGTGSDGDVVLTSSTTISRNMNYRNLTINSGVTLNTGNYRIFVNGTLTNNGTIYAGTVAGGGGGGVSGNGISLNGKPGSTGGSTSYSIGGSGSAGSAGGSGSFWAGGGSRGAGGAGGAISVPSVIPLPTTLLNDPSIVLNGGGGGGGGGGGAAGYGEKGTVATGGTGGSGGSGGGVTVIFAKSLNNANGIISANGTAGASGSPGGGAMGGSRGGTGGSGGSGGGGGVYLVYDSLLQGTITASGASAGQILFYTPKDISAAAQIQSINRTNFTSGLGNTQNITKWFSLASEAVLDQNIVVAQEYSSDGVLETQTKADKTVTLFENNKPAFVLDQDGNTLIEYSYDAAGNPTRVYLKHARDALPDEVTKARAKVEEERQKALLKIVEAKVLAYQDIKSQADTLRSELSSQISQIQSQINDLENTKVRGSKNKKAKSRALDDGRNVLNQAWGQWNELHRLEADAYARLDQEAQAASDKVVSDADAAFREITRQEAQYKKEIIRQEVSPIVYHYYRTILGRDPASDEYSFWIEQINYESGNTAQEIKTLTGITLTQALKDSLNAKTELTQRQNYVTAVKQNVTTLVNQYLAMSQAEREVYAQSLHLTASELILLTASDAAKILAWLNSRPLHFGQSAFLALESLLDQKSIPYNREELATRTILIDILTGVISPLDEGDLILSIYALNKTASLYGVSLTAARLSYQDLLSLYSLNPNLRLIVHINENHFVVVTSVSETEVTYIDTGIGADKQNESITITKDGFLNVWKGYASGEDPIIRSQVLPSQILTREQAQSVRGAFWGSLLRIIGFVLKFTPLAPIAPLFDIAAILVDIATIVVDIVKGNFISAIAGAVSLGFQFFDFGALFKGTFSGIGKLGGIGKFFSGIFQPVAGFFGKFVPKLSGFLSGTLGFSSELASGISEFAVSTGLSIGISKGLDVIGVPAQLSNTISSFATGAVLGATTKLTDAQIKAGLTQKDLIRSNIMTTLTINDVGTLGLRLGLNPTLTSIAALSLGAIKGNSILNPTTSLEKAFKNVLPDIVRTSASYGLTDLGTSLGLDPRISSLISVPISSTLSGLVGNLVAPSGGGGPGAIFNSIKNSLLSSQTFGGLVSVGAFALEDATGIPALLSTAGFTTLTSGLQGVLRKEGFFKGVSHGYRDSVLEFLGLPGINENPNDPNFKIRQQTRMVQTVSFLSMIQEKGLVGALQSHATSIFSKQGVEAIFERGGIADFVTHDAKIVHISNRNLIEIKVGDKDYIYLNPVTENLEMIRHGNTQIIGDFGFDENGNFGLRDGFHEQKISDSQTIRLDIQNGLLSEANIDINGVRKYTAFPLRKGSTLQIAEDGTIINGILVDHETGMMYAVKDGLIINTLAQMSNRHPLSQPTLKDMQTALIDEFNRKAISEFIRPDIMASNEDMYKQQGFFPSSKVIMAETKTVAPTPDGGIVEMAFREGTHIMDGTSIVYFGEDSSTFKGKVTSGVSYDGATGKISANLKVTAGVEVDSNVFQEGRTYFSLAGSTADIATRTPSDAVRFPTETGLETKSRLGSFINTTNVFYKAGLDGKVATVFRIQSINEITGKLTEQEIAVTIGERQDTSRVYVPTVEHNVMLLGEVLQGKRTALTDTEKTGLQSFMAAQFGLANSGMSSEDINRLAGEFVRIVPDLGSDGVQARAAMLIQSGIEPALDSGTLTSNLTDAQIAQMTDAMQQSLIGILERK